MILAVEVERESQHAHIVHTIHSIVGGSLPESVDVAVQQGIVVFVVVVASSKVIANLVLRVAGEVTHFKYYNSTDSNQI